MGAGGARRGADEAGAHTFVSSRRHSEYVSHARRAKARIVNFLPRRRDRLAARTMPMLQKSAGESRACVSLGGISPGVPSWNPPSRRALRRRRRDEDAPPPPGSVNSASSSSNMRSACTPSPSRAPCPRRASIVGRTATGRFAEPMPLRADIALKPPPTPPASPYCDPALPKDALEACGVVVHREVDGVVRGVHRRCSKGRRPRHASASASRGSRASRRRAPPSSRTHRGRPKPSCRAPPSSIDEGAASAGAREVWRRPRACRAAVSTRSLPPSVYPPAGAVDLAPRPQRRRRRGAGSPARRTRNSRWRPSIGLLADGPPTQPFACGRRRGCVDEKWRARRGRERETVRLPRRRTALRGPVLFSARPVNARDAPVASEAAAGIPAPAPRVASRPRGRCDRRGSPAEAMASQRAARRRRDLTAHARRCGAQAGRARASRAACRAAHSAVLRELAEEEKIRARCSARSEEVS